MAQGELLIGTTPVRHIVISEDGKRAYGFDTPETATDMAKGALAPMVGANYTVVPEFRATVSKRRGRRPADSKGGNAAGTANGAPKTDSVARPAAKVSAPVLK